MSDVFVKTGEREGVKQISRLRIAINSANQVQTCSVYASRHVRTAREKSGESGREGRPIPRRLYS